MISLREIFFSIIRLHSMQMGLLWPKANGSREIVLPLAPFSGRGGRGVRGDKCPISKTVLRIQHPLPLIPNPISPDDQGEGGKNLFVGRACHSKYPKFSRRKNFHQASTSTYLKPRLPDQVSHSFRCEDIGYVPCLTSRRRSRHLGSTNDLSETIE